MGRAKDLKGQRFGRWFVIEKTEVKNGKVYWLCKCDCGNTKTVCAYSLTSGKSQSCGCLHHEMISEQAKQQWQDEEFYRIHSEKAKRQWQDEEFRSSHTGVNSPTYNPNLTDEQRKENESRSNDREWVACATRVKKRDNNTCQCCGHEQEKGMIAHHKNGWDNFEEQRYDDNNVVTLCESCHKEFHHIYGYGNNTKEQYEEFKMNKQNTDTKAEEIA